MRIVFCVPFLFRRHVCLSNLKHAPSRKLPLIVRKTVFSHLKSSLFLRSTCNLRRVMIKYKARARKEDTSVPLPAHPRRFTSAPYFHLSCNCAQISQRTLTSALFKLSSNCEHWCNTSLFVADLRRFYQAASEYSKVNVASRASRRVNQIAF